jgi:hypothetical protein
MSGIHRGLVSYGDPEFLPYLRRAFLHVSGRSPGDRIRLSVSEARLDLLVPPEELGTRRAALAPRRTTWLTGYPRLFRDHVLGADRGCDFDFCLPVGKLVAGP